MRRLYVVLKKGRGLTAAGDKAERNVGDEKEGKQLTGVWDGWDNKSSAGGDQLGRASR
jgi:hypothetical protein